MASWDGILSPLVATTGRHGPDRHFIESVSARAPCRWRPPSTNYSLVARIRARAPTYTMEDFLRAFRFDADTATLLRQAAKQIGFDTSAH